jgi:hypothetical protein
MRTTLLALALSLILGSLVAGEAAKPTYVNAKVSAKEICLNETLRVEFTTMPREIADVDIVKSISNSLRLSASKSWHLVGEPQVTESLRLPSLPTNSSEKPASGEKPAKGLKPITVVFSLLPRTPGDLTLPDLPLTWLLGNNFAKFNTVTVVSSILVAGKRIDMPQEANGVGGFAWSSTLDEVRTRVSNEQIKKDGARTIITPKPQLTLIYTEGLLGEAILRAPALTLDVARTEFLQRWGIPQQDDSTSLTWFIGWTRITARTDPAGITLSLVREDIQAKLAKAQISFDIFNVLENPKETDSESKERKDREIQVEVNRPAVPEK